MGTPDHLICLRRNLYAGQEAIVRTGRGTTDWFQIGKWVKQRGIWSPCLFNLYAEFSSVQFNCSAMSDSETPWPQHTRPPCPSPTPRACSNSCPSSQWCQPMISSSVVFSSHFQSFPASEFFPMSQFFTSGSQGVGASALASVLPMNIQDWFTLGWTSWISLQSKGLSRAFSNTTVKNISSSVLSLLYGPTVTSIHDYWKNHSFDDGLCQQSNISAF